MEIPASDKQSIEPKPLVAEQAVTEPVVAEESIVNEPIEDEPVEQPKPQPTSIPQEPLAKIKLAAELDVRTDRLNDEDQIIQALMTARSEQKKSLLTKETLRRINSNSDSAWADPEMWNELTGGIAALRTTDKLEDEKADIIFENMFNKEKEGDVNRALKIANINQQLHGMRSKRTTTENVIFDTSKVFHDLFQSGWAGVKTGATLGAGGAVVGAVTSGPFGAAALGVSGAVAGFSRGMMTHMVYDGYIKSSSAAYEQLGNVVNETGEHLTQEERRNIALGVGTVSTALGFFGQLPMIKMSPLGRLFNGEGLAAKLVSAAEYKPVKEALKKLGTSLALNGTTEGMTVYVNKIGEAIGQAHVDENFDKTKFWDTVMNLGNLQEAAYSAGIATLGMSPLSAISYKGAVAREANSMIVDRAGEFNRMRMDGIPEHFKPKDMGELQNAIEGKPYEADVKAVENKISEATLAAKRDIDWYTAVDNVTEMWNKPEFKDKSFREKVGGSILELAGIDHLFIDPIKMGQIVMKLDNDSIKARIEEQLGRNLTNITGAPIKVSAIDFINMAHEAPQIKEAFLRSASSEVAETANNFIKKVGDTVNKFKNNKDAKALDMVNDIVFTEHVNGSSLPYGTKNYHDFLKLEEIIPEELWKTLTPKEQAELNGVVNPAKIEVIKNLNLDRTEIKNELLDVVRLRLIDEQKKINQKELYEDKDRQNIDAYAASRRKGEPLLNRIDPKSLNPKLKKRFLENPRLKELNVFDQRNGKHIDDVTAELGYDNNYHTLETLSSAYSTGELEFMASQSDKLFIDGEVVDVKKRFNDSAHIEKQLSDGQAIFRQVAEKQLEIINKKTEGSVEKKVIFKLPKNETIDYYTKETVENNSIYDLGDETQYSNMVKKHQMSAWKFMRDGDYKKAVESWTSALYANRMAAEVRVARQRVFKLANAIKDLNSEDTQQMFQQAGGFVEDAGKELYQLFTVPNAEVRKIEAYRTAQKARGIYVPPIRARRNKRQLVDLTQMSGGEVRDLLQLTNSLVKQADTKSTLIIKRNNQEEQLFLQNDRTQIMNSMNTADRTIKRSVVGQGFDWIKSLKDNYITDQTKVGTLATIVDGYKNGSMSRIIQDIKAQYDMAQVAKQNLNSHIDSIIGEFETKNGKGSFEKMGSKEIFVEEFADNRFLRNGNMTERELFGLLAHLGNESSRKRTENFGFTADELQGIVEHHLSEAHFDTMQKFWDIYETFKDPITKVNKEVHGFSDTQFIPARDFEAHGKIYKGGYFPAIAEHKGTTLLLESILGNFVENKKQLGEVNFKYTGIEDFTNTDRLKTRAEDTKHILSLDPEHLIYSYSALTHDIHMRPVLDYAGKMFNNRKFLESLNGFFGNETDSNEFVRYLQVMGDNSHKGEQSTKLLTKFVGVVNTAHVVGQLALKPLTVVAQHFSQLMVPTQLKDKGAYIPEMLREYGTIAKNPLDWSTRVKFFANHDPHLLTAFDEINDLNHKAVTMFGKPRYENKVLNFLSHTREAMMNKTMASLKYSDITAQIVARSTLYRMAMEGKLINEGIKPGDEQAALNFARDVSEKTVTGNDLGNLSHYQRNPIPKTFLMTYMSGLNLSYNLLRENANKISDGYNMYRKEQETSVLEPQGKAMMGDGIMNIGFIVASTAILPAVARGLWTMNDDKKKKDDTLAKDMTVNLFSPFSFVSGVAFSMANQWNKNVLPIQQQAQMVTEAAQWYFNLLTLQMKNPSKDKRFKSAMLETGNVMGLPSNQMWNTMLSPEARKNWNKAGRTLVGTVLGQFQSFNADELLPEEKEIFDYYSNTLQQLQNGNMQPLHDINEAIKNEPSIQSGENESPIPSNDFVKPETVRTEKEFKPLTEDEKMGVGEWFKSIFKSESKTKDVEDTTPIQQDAPEEDSAPPIEDQFLPSSGTEVSDAKVLESVAKLYAKKGLDTNKMSKSAFVEYNDLKDKYLAVLNDSTISEQNKLMRLSAIVVAAGESFKSVAYDDKNPNKVLSKTDKIKGVLTIGYGFTKNVKIGDSMTEEQGAQRLITELESRRKILNSAENKHGLDLNINQQVALISAIYNGAWNPDKFKNSTAAIKKGYFEPLLANTLESSSQTNIDGLLKRRLLEYLIFKIAPPIAKTANKNNLTAKTNWQDTIVR